MSKQELVDILKRAIPIILDTPEIVLYNDINKAIKELESEIKTDQ